MNYLKKYCLFVAVKFVMLLLFVTNTTFGAHSQTYNIGGNTIAYSSLGKVWYGSATTTSGVATFNIDTLGTGLGLPLFATIKSAIATANLNTSTATSVPICSVKLIAADRKTVSVNVITGVVIPPPRYRSIDSTICAKRNDSIFNSNRTMRFEVKILCPSKSTKVWSITTMEAEDEKQLKQYLDELYLGTDTQYEVTPI